MELSELASQIFHGQTLEDKLTRLPDTLGALTDDAPGRPVAWREPGRVARLQIAPKKLRRTLPHPDSLDRDDMRARCLHTFANHELMALELCAWALLAWPDAPAAFRRGLAWLIVEEQEHLRLYTQRLERMGIQFGSLPLNDHFWRIAHQLSSPAQWVAAMNLTFEQANLDHAPTFARRFAHVDDHDSAALLARITEDEIRHVAFGARWLSHFAGPDTMLWDAYLAALTPYNSPQRALDPDHFNRAAREAAGLPASFIDSLLAAHTA
jgi:uncharacterized ferritin-like protein (DUF455 family)